jgi:uridylate kinase
MAFTQMTQRKIPIIVLNIFKADNIVKAIEGQQVGTLIC